eukprot:35616_1
MFTHLDLSQLQKKLLENPKISLGAAGVAAIALLYALGKSNDLDDHIDALPDYAKPDIDPEFTQRFISKRKRTLSNHKGKRPRAPLSNLPHNPHAPSDLEHKEEEVPKYSVLDPSNPNYSYDMNRDRREEEQTDESDGEEGFSVDEYYVPFRVHNAKTKRQPDAPFMAMFTMYANRDKSAELMQTNRKHRSDSDIINDIYDTQHVEEQDGNEEEKKENSNDDDNGSSPPLNPQIPSHNLKVNGIEPIMRSSLDTLREMYYKQDVPQSLQPDVLSNAFSSKSQQAIQNKLDPDDSLLG